MTVWVWVAVGVLSLGVRVGWGVSLGEGVHVSGSENGVRAVADGVIEGVSSAGVV